MKQSSFSEIGSRKSLQRLWDPKIHYHHIRDIQRRIYSTCFNTISIISILTSFRCLHPGLLFKVFRLMVCIYFLLPIFMLRSSAHPFLFIYSTLILCCKRTNCGTFLQSIFFTNSLSDQTFSSESYSHTTLNILR